MNTGEPHEFEGSFHRCHDPLRQRSQPQLPARLDPVAADAAAVDLWAARDEWMRACVRLHGMRVRGLLRRFKGLDDHDIDDLTQETWIKAQRYAFPENMSPFTMDKWILEVASNLAKDHLKSRNRYREHLKKMTKRSGPAVDVSDRVHDVLLALLTLDPELADRFRERHLDGLMPARIAERLGVDVRKVSAQLAKARKKIRIVLGVDRIEKLGD